MTATRRAHPERALLTEEDIRRAVEDDKRQEVQDYLQKRTDRQVRTLGLDTLTTLHGSGYVVLSVGAVEQIIEALRAALRTIPPPADPLDDETVPLIEDTIWLLTGQKPQRVLLDEINEIKRFMQMVRPLATHPARFEGGTDAD